MPTSTDIKGVANIGSASISQTIKSNLVEFFNWNFINKGGFFNVNIPASGAYGGHKHRLRSVDDPRYTAGTIWEGFRKDWVWESGLDFTSQPNSISGVFIDNVFNAENGGTYTINYPLGRINFNSAISTSSIVQLDYSFRWTHVTDVKSVPFLREPQRRSFRVDDSNFLPGSGRVTKLAESREQLPLVAIELVSRKSSPYQLGQGQYVQYTAKFHIIGEDDWSVSKIADIIANQSEKTIFMFDLDLMAAKSAFPLNHTGSVTNTAKTYPDLVALSGDGGYRTGFNTEHAQYGKLRMYDAKSQDGAWINNNIYMNTVTMIAEVILPSI